MLQFMQMNLSQKKGSIKCFFEGFLVGTVKNESQLTILTFIKNANKIDEQAQFLERAPPETGLSVRPKFLGISLIQMERSNILFPIIETNVWQI